MSNITFVKGVRSKIEWLTFCGCKETDGKWIEDYYLNTLRCYWNEVKKDKHNV